MLASLSNISAYAGDYNPDANYWNFTTRNGCDTRNRVLQAQALTTAQWAQAQPLTPSDGTCPVTYGVVGDPLRLGRDVPDDASTCHP